MIRVQTPISKKVVQQLKVGDQSEIYGKIFCARDAVLPKLTALFEKGGAAALPVDLEGTVIFHTAVSIAGVGPTSSNKVEIEESIPALSRAGVRIHLGKGALSASTARALNKYGSVFAVTPPASALFNDRTVSQKIAAFPKEGMEALWELEVKGLPAIIAIVQGKTIFKRRAK